MTVDSQASCDDAWLPTSAVKCAAAHYAAIRSAVAEGSYDSALQQGWELLDVVCGGSPRQMAAGQALRWTLPQAPLQHLAAAGTQQAQLTVSAVANLLLCAVHTAHGLQLAEFLAALMQPLRVLPSWIRCLCAPMSTTVSSRSPPLAAHTMRSECALKLYGTQLTEWRDSALYQTADWLG